VTLTVRTGLPPVRTANVIPEYPDVTDERAKGRVSTDARL
jgi:hypothetical protein